MKLILMAVLLVGCGAAPRRAPMSAPQCSGGVCLFTVSAADARQVCYSLFGESVPCCYDPDIKAGWQFEPGQIDADICKQSADEYRCIQELFE